MKPGARVTVVTSGHLSTCPRMVRAADAFAEAGYRVRVVSTHFIDWAADADRDLRRTRAWDWTVIDYARATARARWLRSGATLHAARRAAAWCGAGALAAAVVARAFSRVHADLVSAIAGEPADFVYGGTTGGLMAVAEGASRLGVRYGLDLEDYHLDQHAGPGAALEHALAARVVEAVAGGAAFVTTASHAMADAWARHIARPLPIYNTVPRPATAPDLQPPGGPLSLYWFSQTIGPGRGLEDAMHAMGRASIDGVLHLRGRAIPEYVAGLHRLQAEAAPRLRLVVSAPAPPDDMVPLARAHHVALSLEAPTITNRNVNLNNKALTAVAAGLAVVLTDTREQRAFAATLGAGAWLYPFGDVDALAHGLARWDRDRAALAGARAASWRAAGTRWHWEHADDRGALLRALEAA